MAEAVAEFFPDGAFVRLESREVKGKYYVHADPDWEGIFLHRNFQVPALNAVWRVQHWRDPVDGITYVALQNTAYGRYLSFSMKPALRGHQGYRVTQMNRDEPMPDDDEVDEIVDAAAAGVVPDLGRYPWLWNVERRPEPDQDYVSLRHFPFYLRANGKGLFWNTGNIGVTASIADDHDPLNDNAPIVPTMMHWRVHRVAESRVQRALLLTRDEEESENAVMFDQNYPARTIRHVLASAQGKFDQNHHKWPSFTFRGRSVRILKNELGDLQGWKENDSRFYTMCMRPGSHGGLMPLACYALPDSLESMNIVVFKTPLPAGLKFRYPAPPESAAMVMD